MNILNELVGINKDIKNGKYVDINKIEELMNHYCENEIINEDGTVDHPFTDPIVAERLNNEYRKVKGENHPNYDKHQKEIIDGLLKDKKMLLDAKAYDKKYFEKIESIKSRLENKGDITQEDVENNIEQDEKNNMPNIEDKDEKRVIDLTNQLNEVSSQLDAVNSNIFEKKTEEKVEDSVGKVTNMIEKEAKRYGQKTEEAQQVSNEFKNSLQDLQKASSEQKNMYTTLSQVMSKKEIESILKILEISKILSNADGKDNINNYNVIIMDNIKIIQITRKHDSEITKNIDECEEQFENTIDRETEQKSLVPQNENNNIFRKIFSKITDKIGGKEKFNKNVVQPMKKKAEYIRNEVVPKIEQELEENVVPIVEELYTKGKEKIQDMKLKEKYNDFKKLAKQGAKNIVQKGKEWKNNVISKYDKDLTKDKEEKEIVELVEQEEETERG